MESSVGVAELIIIGISAVCACGGPLVLLAGAVAAFVVYNNRGQARDR